MSLNAPYRHHNFMGLYATDGAALTFIRNMKWDSTKDGLGTPEEGMLYYNTTAHVMLVWTGAAWAAMITGVPTLASVLGTGNSAGASTVDMNSNKVTAVAAATVAGDALAYGQSGASLSGLALGGQRLTGLGAPSAATDAATKQYVDQLIQGLAWQNEVLSQGDNTPPVGPSLGDRYIIGTAPVGAWAANANDITEWDGAAWVFTPEREGLAAWVLDEVSAYVWNGALWVKFSAIFTVSLDDAYDDGRFITADAGAVSITVPDTFNNVALDIVQNNVTHNPVALLITNAGTGGSLSLAGVTRRIVSDNGALSIETTTAGTLDLDAVGALSINSSAGAINIGDDAIAQSINIGTAGARGIQIGRILNGGLGIATTGAVTLGAVGQNVSIGTATSGNVAINSAGGFSAAFAGGNCTFSTSAASGVRTWQVGTGANEPIVAVYGYGITLTSGNTVTPDQAITLNGGQVALNATDNSTFTLAANVIADVVLSLWATNAAAGNVAHLALACDGELRLEDGWKSGSTYGTDLVLSDAVAEWTAFEANFGEVSILNALNQCSPSSSGWVSVENLDVDIGTEVVDSFVTPVGGGLTGAAFWVWFAVDKDDASRRCGGYVALDWEAGVALTPAVMRSNPAELEPTFTATAVDTGTGTNCTVTLSATVTSDNWTVKLKRAPCMVEVAA